MSKPVKIDPQAPNTVNLKLSGPVKLAQGRALGAELNAILAYYNSLLGRTDPDHEKKLTASTGDPANQ